MSCALNAGREVGSCRANGMRVAVCMPGLGWHGKWRVLTPTVGYFLHMGGAFEEVFSLPIGCSVTAWFFGMVGFCWDVLCSLRSLGGGSCRTKWMSVTASMARPGWHGKSRVFKPTLGYFLCIWGAFQGVFSLLIGCSGNAWFFGMVG